MGFLVYFQGPVLAVKLPGGTSSILSIFSLDQKDLIIRENLAKNGELLGFPNIREST